MSSSFVMTTRTSLFSGFRGIRAFLSRGELDRRYFCSTFLGVCKLRQRCSFWDARRTLVSLTSHLSWFCQTNVNNGRGTADPNINNPYISYYGNDIKISAGGFFTDVEKRLDYKFQNRANLARALLHSSTKTGEVWFDDENMTNVSNERLEFLGDSILNFLVSEHLYRYLPESDEGKLTAMRSLITSGVAEAKYCQGLDIGRYLIIHKNTAKNHRGWNYYSYMNRAHANCMEAVVGGIYIDSGMASVKKFFESKLMPMMVDILRTEAWSWKNVLQELLQSMGETNPDLVYFNVDRNGVETDEFVGRCALNYNGDRVGEGQGASRNRAESDAAHNAIVRMGVHYDSPTFENEGQILAERLQEQKLGEASFHEDLR